jgi:hypothetical protein
MRKIVPILTLILLLLCAPAWAKKSPPESAATQPLQREVGEKVPSEDSVLKDFHSLGLINGRTNIFRCACPVRDIAKKMSATQPSAADLAEARQRMKRLYDLGIRTVISFQKSENDGDDAHQADVAKAIALEKAAAADVGLTYLAEPMANAGKDSLEDMSDQAVMQWADQVAAIIFKSADSGGVAFHCSAGHDRTGIIAAYLRLKYEHWPVDQAIDEMRRYGHNWLKYSKNGGISSWHEDHLRAIAKMLN